MILRHFHIQPAVFLAPMAGITDLPFRRIVRCLGCPAVVTEMVSAEGIIRNGKGSRKLLKSDPAERPVFVQLFGARPDSLAEAACRVSELDFDGIDINMGCPVPKVVRNGAGAALMREPDRAEAVVRAVRQATDLPLTVKLRAGWTEAERNAPELAKRLAGAGADAITIHGRTRSQGYSGQADWSIIRSVVEAVAVPVIGNGDIRSPEDGQTMREQTGCAGVMVGRGALGNPWLPGALAGRPYPPTFSERYEVFCHHLDSMLVFLGSEVRAVQRMRKHLVCYARGLHGAQGLRRRLDQFLTAEQMKSAFAQLLSKADPERGPERVDTPCC